MWKKLILSVVFCIISIIVIGLNDTSVAYAASSLKSFDGSDITKITISVNNLDSSGNCLYRGIDAAVFQDEDGDGTYAVKTDKVSRVITDSTNVEFDLGNVSDYQEGKIYKVGYRVLYSPLGDSSQIIIEDAGNGKDGWKLIQNNGSDIWFTLPSAPVALSSIAITTPATKLSYTVGDMLDLSGLVVTGTYSDTSTQVETVTAANVTGFNSSAVAANQVLTITIGGKTTIYTVNIVAAPTTQLLTSNNANVTVDNTTKTITYPMYAVDGTNFTQLANIKSVIAAVSGYTYEIYKADRTTVATTMEVTNVLKVLQGGNIVETYTFAANIKYGDVNGDGSLNTADLTLLTRYLLNSTNYPFEKPYGLKAADINKDNVVNSSDKVLLQRYLTNAQTYPIPSPTEFLYNPLN